MMITLTPGNLSESLCLLLLILGILLFFGGTGIMEIQQISIRKGLKTTFVGIFCIIGALVLGYGKFFNISTNGFDVNNSDTNYSVQNVEVFKTEPKLTVCYKKKEKIIECINTGRKKEFQYYGCVKQSTECGKQGLKDFGYYTTEHDADIAFWRCRQSTPLPKSITTVSPYKFQDNILPKKLKRNDYHKMVINAREKIIVYARPFEKESKIITVLKPNSKNIAIYAYVSIGKVKWCKISCFDVHKNEYDGWIKYKYLEQNNGALNFIATDGSEIKSATAMITPVIPKDNIEHYQHYVVNVKKDPDLNVRGGPGGDFQVVVRLAKNSRNIKIKKSQGFWKEITFLDAYNNKYCGWVHANYLK